MHTCINKHNFCQCNVVYVFVPFNTFIQIMNVKIFEKFIRETNHKKKNN